MKYIYTIHYLEYSPEYERDCECSMRIIDKNGDLGYRALKNRGEARTGTRPERITRVECMCYEP